MSHHLTPNQPNELGAAGEELRMYSVQVGHTTTTVPGRTPAEAIHEARRRFCQEMPRMWDVIQQLDDSRFTVVETAESGGRKAESGKPKAES